MKKIFIRLAIRLLKKIDEWDILEKSTVDNEIIDHLIKKLEKYLNR